MMTAVRGSFPGGLFAAGGPLPRHPPATDFVRPRPVLEVYDRYDIAAVTMECGGAVDIAAVEREAMHAAGRPGRDPCRLRRIGHIEDLETAFEMGIDAANREDFTVDQHNAVFDAHFMRQRHILYTSFS